MGLPRFFKDIFFFEAVLSFFRKGQTKPLIYLIVVPLDFFGSFFHTGH